MSISNVSGVGGGVTRMPTQTTVKRQQAQGTLRRKCRKQKERMQRKNPDHLHGRGTW